MAETMLRELCCSEDQGLFEHYHCARCGAVVDLVGHDEHGCGIARRDGRARSGFAYEAVAR